MESAARPRNRREQITREATRLFAEKGYQGTSIRLIARACGISEAAIYRHFESKVDLYDAVIQNKAGQHDISGYLNNKGDCGDIEAVLTTVARHILSYLENDPELLRLMFNNSVESGPVAAVLFREVRLPYIQFLSSELDQRMASGEIVEVDSFITARCFVGMVMDCALSVAVWAKISDFQFNANNVICNNVPIFARGLQANPAHH